MRDDSNPSTPPLWPQGERIFHGVCTLFLIFVVGLLWATWAEAASETPASDSRAALPSVRLDDVQSGELLFQSAQPNEYHPALLLDTQVTIRASGLLANVRLTQRFRNDSQSWVEGVYVFPLPEQAAVYAMSMKVGERLIVGEIQEKAQAQATYRQAVQQGQRAVLVEQQRPNLFTNHLANIGPGETIEVTLDYQQTLDYHDGQFSLRFPMTLTPRYMPGQVQLDAPQQTALLQAWQQGQQVDLNPQGWALNTDQVPDAAQISPDTVPTRLMDARSHHARLDVEIRSGLPLADIRSSSHPIEWHRVNDAYQVELVEDHPAMDRDFVLSWQPEPDQAPQAALFKETLNGETYALLMLLPPQDSPAQLALPREMIWVVDTSGSMEGVSLRQAKAALHKALATLRPGDRFNIIQFNSTTSRLFAQAVALTPEHLAQAEDYVDALRADGGTEMAQALDAALGTMAPAGYVRQVVFLTDGSVGNEAALFRQIRDDLGDSRLFTVGIGPAPNSFFMRKAAAFGRGTMTMISSENEVAEGMTQLFDKLRAPVMRDIQVDWPGNGAVDQAPEAVPDLYRGEPLVVLARIQQPSGSLEVAGFQAGELKAEQPLWSRRLDLQHAIDAPGIARAWARRKIEQLLDQKVTGEAESSIRAQVLPLALQHQLVSPYTSLVAVDKTPARPLDESLKAEGVASLLPAGVSEKMVRMPRTATDSTLKMLIGGSLLVLSILLWTWGDRRLNKLHQRRFNGWEA